MSEYQLFEIIEEARENMGYNDYEIIDPVYCVLEHILQNARNCIEEVTGYDFLNNFSGDTEIYTDSNYMCSCYDYSSVALEELREKTSEHLDILNQNKWCRYFLSELEIGV